MKRSTKEVLALVRNLDLVELAALLREAEKIFKIRQQQKRKVLATLKKERLLVSEHELVPLLKEMAVINDKKDN